MRRLAQLVVVALALVAAAHVALAAEPGVVLISLDGTRPSDVRDLPTFRRIAERGAFGAGIVPAFPSNTFPNHVTFVTGVSPDRHGVVNNVFVDPTRGLYRYANDPSWIEVEPIWSIAARAGIASASYFWVGSEGAWRNGLGPREWKKFDPAVPESEKVRQILAWLAAPDPPRLVTSWFHGADGAAHRYGPDAPEVAETLRAQDAALGELLDGLEARGLMASTTLLLVSDHGMVPVERSVDLEAALENAGIDAQVIGGGGFATLRLPPRKRWWLFKERPSIFSDRSERAARAVAVARGLGLEAWVRGAGPREYAASNVRFGDVVAIAPLGVLIVGRAERLGEAAKDLGEAALGPLGALAAGRTAQAADALGAGPLRGEHGHRPELPEMAGLFAAVGRGVEPGARPAAVRAVDVAPTVLSLLGVTPPEWMEGRPVPLRSERAKEKR
jgi:predicted AlkP superfamily pyrophosphatase or phosphodiesterase